MPPRRLPLRLVLSAAAIAAGAAGCSGHSGHPAASPPTTAPSTPAATAPPTTASSPAPYTWARDRSPALQIGGGSSATITSVLAPAPGRGWIVTGTRTGPSGIPTATVWTSTNGVTWQAVALTSARQPSQADGVTELHTRAVIVGAVGSGPNRRAAVWLSAEPGAPFTGVSLASTPGSIMQEVTSGTLGIFALGVASGEPTVWTSADGSRWAPSPDAAKTIGASPGAEVSSILATTNEVYLAGSVRSGTDINAALWHSSDGIHWYPIESARLAFAGPSDRVITALAPLGTGLIAVGGVLIGTRWSPAAWISPDGASWSQPSEAFPMTPSAQPDATGAVVRGLSAVPTLSGQTILYAVGGSNTAQHVWTSPDGIHWAEIPLPPPAAASAGWRATLIASDGSSTVVADGDAGQPHLLVHGAGGWSEPSATPTVFGAVQVAAQPTALVRSAGTLELTVTLDSPSQRIGPPARASLELRSADGVDWTAMPAGAAGLPQPPPGSTGTARLGDRWVAVSQSDGATPDAPSDVITEGLAVASVSSNGVTWSAARPLDPHPGLTVEQPEALCTRRATVVAVGAQAVPGVGSATAAWWSSDGVRWSPAAVTPTGASGGSDEMAGCNTTAAGFVAYGAGVAAGGGDEPAVWSSATGTRWARTSVGSFGKNAPDLLTGLAQSGRTWLAVASAGSALADSLLASPPGLPEAAVWWSANSGGTWQRLDTASSLWQGQQITEVTGVAFTGPDVVVAGQVDGRLAVWLGTPAQPAA